MAMVLYKKGTTRKPKYEAPMATKMKTSNGMVVRISKKAMNLLNFEPTHYVIYFDDVSKQIGILFSKEKVENSYKFNPKTAFVQLQGVAKLHKINMEEFEKRKVKLDEDGMLCIDVADLVE